MKPHAPCSRPCTMHHALMHTHVQVAPPDGWKVKQSPLALASSHCTLSCTVPACDMYSCRLAFASLLCVTLQLLEAWATTLTMQVPVSAAAMHLRGCLPVDGATIEMMLLLAARIMAPFRKFAPIGREDNGINSMGPEGLCVYLVVTRWHPGDSISWRCLFRHRVSALSDTRRVDTRCLCATYSHF